MIYLIGGSRCSGRSMLAQRISNNTGIPVVFTKSLTPAVIAASQYRAIRSMWPPTKELIEHAIICNQDFIIVGRHFPPSDMQVLIGTKLWKHIKIIYLVKKKNMYVDWMYPTMLDRIFPQFKNGFEVLDSTEKKIGKYSTMIIQEAKKYKFKVINTEYNFEKKLDEAQKYLTGSV